MCVNMLAKTDRCSFIDCTIFAFYTGDFPPLMDLISSTSCFAVSEVAVFAKQTQSIALS